MHFSTPCSSPLRIIPILCLGLALGGLRAEVAVAGRVALPEAHSAPVMNKRYEIITQGGVLSTNPPRAVVYLEGEFPPAAGTLPVEQIAQEGMAFQPALLTIRTGTTVEFPNRDGVYHNIFSYSPAKRFDLGRYRREDLPVPAVVFDHPGLVVLRCDIHEHMRGLVLVLDTPYFVITDAAGNYRLTGLPAGKYKLTAWLDSRTTLERSVELRDGEPLRVDFP